MKTPVIVFFLLVSVALKAQHKHEYSASKGRFASFQDALNPVQIFCHIKLETFETGLQQAVLSPALKAAGYGQLPVSDFAIEYQRESMTGTFVQFRFAPGGVPAFSNYVKVYYDKHNTIREIFVLLQGCEKWTSQPFADEQLVRQQLGALQVLSFQKRWFFDGASWHGAWLTDVKKDIAATGERRLYAANMEMLFSEPTSQQFAAFAADTMVSGKVFRPDPLTSAQKLYGGKYQDFMDNDSPEINNERVWVRFKAVLKNDTFFLSDTNFRFAELEGPDTPIPFSLDTVFEYNRSDENFEYINAMYHLQTFRDRTHAMGFKLPGYLIEVDPHAANGADFSAFSASYTPPVLFFGDGGIDDAEDADVLVHELGHAMIHGAAPYTFEGAEKKAGDEGTCDYLAMTYSRSVNPFNWQKTFSWDGNQTWQGRVMNSDNVYPDSVVQGDIYTNSEMWSACLAEIYDSLGAGYTDSLVFASMYHLASNMSFPQRCLSMMLADSSLSNAANIRVLHYFFHKRGFLGPLGVSSAMPGEWKIYNSYGFSLGEYVEVAFAGEALDMTVQLVDIQGRILKEDLLNDQYSYRLESAGIEKGVYFLRLQSSTHPLVTIRLVKF